MSFTARSMPITRLMPCLLKDLASVFSVLLAHLVDRLAVERGAHRSGLNLQGV